MVVRSGSSLACPTAKRFVDWPKQYSLFTSVATRPQGTTQYPWDTTDGALSENPRCSVAQATCGWMALRHFGVMRTVHAPHEYLGPKVSKPEDTRYVM